MPHPEIGVGHVGGHLLVAWRDQGDAVARFVKGIQDADVAVPANPENVRDFAVDQIFGDEVRTLHPWHRVPPVLVGLSY